ncbi:MAG: DUF2868 domain-containing protein [Acidobacteriota bacterium]
MSAGAERILRLSADTARSLVATAALEEVDRGGLLLPLDARRRATREALDEAFGGADAAALERAVERPEAWLPARARRLEAPTVEVLGRAGGVLGRVDPLAGWAPLILVVALVGGLATNALGPQRAINVLAVPLLALVAWNLVVVALGLVRGLLPPAWGGLDPARRPRLLGVLDTRLRRWVLRRAVRNDPTVDSAGTSSDPPSGSPNHTQDHEMAARRREVLTLFLRRWGTVAMPLHAARLRRLLHLGALVTVLGVVVGMYARGLLFEYRATWESTFLGGAAVDRLLGVVLGPAAVLAGVEVPSAAAIQSPADGPAAPWIHLWALTAALFVGLPRGLLTVVEQLRAARRCRRLPVPVTEGALRRLLTGAASAEHAARVLPYSYRPVDRAVRHLKTALLDLLGPRARLRVAEPASYGDPAPEPSPGDLRVVLFGLAQTPEAEVHGELLAALRRDLPDGQGLLVVIDEAPYRRRLEGRLGADADERLAARRRAWSRVVADVELAPVFLDLEHGVDDAALDRLAAAVWPRGAGGLVWAPSP